MDMVEVTNSASGLTVLPSGQAGRRRTCPFCPAPSAWGLRPDGQDTPLGGVRLSGVPALFTTGVQ